VSRASRLKRAGKKRPSRQSNKPTVLLADGTHKRVDLLTATERQEAKDVAKEIYELADVCGRLIVEIDACGLLNDMPEWMSPWLADSLLAREFSHEPTLGELRVAENEMTRWLAEPQKSGTA
jgi:hypothetical protein